ncbi:MAG: hypothetical protein NUV61_02985 [Candidatus Azambacteria bacterium]|nr:hypothetical protein [Candidatus Azambacteria bacterium]
MEIDALNLLATKTKELIKNESAKANIDIDNYSAMATGRSYAAHDDIQHAIEEARNTKDVITGLKSAAIIEIDNIVKGAISQ